MEATDSFWSSVVRARVSRRRLLAGSAVLSGSAIAWAACGGEDGDSAQQEPQRGGTLRLGTTTPYSGLDPQTEAGTGLEITARLYGYMLHADSRDDSIIYDQVESVEQPDQLTFVFTLRPDVRFQDVDPVRGRRLNAEDVVRSVERFRDNPVATTKTFHTSILDRIDAPDALTVRVTTKRPYVYSLAYLGDIGAGAIIPSELIESNTSLYTTAAGSGPFRLDSASPPDRARLLRHDGYFRAPIPYLDAMRWQVYGDAASAVSAMRVRDIDILTGSPDDVQPLAEENPDITVSQEPNLSWLALGMRLDRAPFSDARVREAIDLALDRDTMIRDLARSEGQISGPVNPYLGEGYWSLSDDELRAAFGGEASIDDRRTQSTQLLDAAAAEGATFTLQVADIPALIDIADVVRQQLQAVGLTVRVEPAPLLSWFTNFRRGAFEATLVSHLPYETPDVPLRLFHSAGPDATGSPFAFGDATIDALVERSWGEADRARRQATVREAQRLMIKARPLLQLYASTGYQAAWRQVQNLRPGLPGSFAHYNYEQWLLEDEAD